MAGESATATGGGAFPGGGFLGLHNKYRLLCVICGDFCRDLTKYEGMLVLTAPKGNLS